MPQFNERGQFAGLSGDDKAAAVYAELQGGEEKMLHQLTAATGLTEHQIHTGIRHLREVRGDQCVITIRRGPLSAFRLAEDAPEVRDYAIRRIKLWRGQVQVMLKEMETARKLLPQGDAATVGLALDVLKSLLGIMNYDEQVRQSAKRMARKDRSLV